MIFFTGKVRLPDLSLSMVSSHWATTPFKSLLHHILTLQDGALDLRLPRRFYLQPGNDETPTLTWCDRDGVCRPVDEEEAIGEALNQYPDQLTSNM